MLWSDATAILRKLETSDERTWTDAAIGVDFSGAGMALFAAVTA